MKKIYYLLVIGLLIVLAFFIACRNTETPVINSPTEEVSSNGITGGAIGVPIETKTETPKLGSAPTYEPRLQDLIDKTKGINNYRFHYHTLRLNPNGLYLEDLSYEILVRDNKAKKVYVEVKKAGPNLYYNEVYLDLNEKTAYSVCALSGVICKGLGGKIYKVNYEEEIYPTSPLEIIEKIPSDAKITGTTIFNNHQVTTLEFKLPTGNMKRLYLDNYYGLPLKEEEYKVTEDGDLMLLNRDFIPMIVGSGTVKTFEVNLPSDLTFSN